MSSPGKAWSSTPGDGDSGPSAGASTASPGLAGRFRVKSARPRARFGPTAEARMRGVLRRPLSLSQLCVVSVPRTISGSPLLTLPETFPDRSFQHSTSTQKVPASTNS